MSALYIDITELVGWKGRLTGVPRVMSELSTRYHSVKNSAVFVSWDRGVEGYRPVDLETITDRKQAPEHNNFELEAPMSIRSKVYVKTKSIVKRSSRLSTLASKTLAHNKSRKFGSEPKDVLYPKAGDVLFVLSDWHGSDPMFINKLILWKKNGVKLAHFVYDILPIVTPQYSGHATESLTKYSKLIYPLCDVMFSISNNTKHDVEEWLATNNLRSPEIKVIRLGDDFKFAKPVKPKNGYYSEGKQFILCVGTIEARKNHTLLYYTYKLAKQDKIELPDVVIVGRRGWLSDDIYELITKDPDTKNRFIFEESLSDEELSWLYDKCLFTVYPSFYEGWGLPIAESIARGVTCICSNTSSMPEVAGKYAKYFSPYSASDCLGVISDMLDIEVRSKLEKQISQYTTVSWDDTFEVIKKEIGTL